ncbi:MAG: hypothetical protein JSR37_10095 [Verrucomicrobia bacterium]|nr:hypothetical protein [Verrucomicrobiota bacterium]MBS0637587.1 hypothetical protein [Verrucomicrobiota bacterium]
MKKCEKSAEVTFWIQFEPEPFYRINVPNGLIGYGSYKDAKYALEMSPDIKYVYPVVRLLPADKQSGWNITALRGFDMHQKLFEKLRHRGALSCIADPPTYFAEQEFVQLYYPKRLNELKDNVEHILSEFCVLFSTLDGINRQGYMHKDLKPDNIQVNSRNHLVLNDFDHCDYKLHGASSEYEFWDFATQFGLHNPYADVVGGMVCLLYTIFYDDYDLITFERDPTHSLFKESTAVEDVCMLLNSKSGPKKELIELACKVFQAEDRVFSAILSSTVYFFMKEGGAQSFNEFDFDAAHLGLRRYMVRLFSAPELILNTFFTVSEENVEGISNLIVSEASVELGTLDGVIDMLHERLDSRAFGKLRALPIIYSNLYYLITNEDVLDWVELEYADETLFLQLSSHDPLERDKGFKTISEIAPSALDVQLELGSILNKIQKET